MIIGALTLSVHIPYSQSLKDRRRISRSIRKKAKQKFNIAVALEPSDKWKVCKFFFVSVSSSQRELEKAMSNIESFIHNHYSLQTFDVKLDFV
jgi:hypothetical protein